jgi:fermentation-respiration switch protein FrsA (DUF1100 family)
MLRLVHLLIVTLYSVLPAAVLAGAILRRRRGTPLGVRIAGIVVTFMAGLSIAIVLVVVYARSLHSPPPPRQILLAAYFAAAMLLILRGFDAALLWTVRRTLLLHHNNGPSLSRGLRILVVYLVRTSVLLAVGLPYVVAIIAVYRPKLPAAGDPMSRYGFAFERVNFHTSDGATIAGWWIPASDAPASTRPADRRDWGRRTVLICHGMLSDKSHDLMLARRLPPGGFNVLAIDFRAHGQSSGQLTAYGAVEKPDVLAAVKWLQETHPQQTEKLFGVGVDAGAAALISAAADDSPQGRAIDAIAAYAAFDDLGKLAADLSDFYFERPLNWLLLHVGLPIASAHAGADLNAFAPASAIRSIWPRPVLFIHSQHDDVIPFDRGQAINEAASQPRYHVWFPRGSHADILNDDSAAEIVLQFFSQARSVPVI